MWYNRNKPLWDTVGHLVHEQRHEEKWECVITVDLIGLYPYIMIPISPFVLLSISLFLSRSLSLAKTKQSFKHVAHGFSYICDLAHRVSM